MTTENATPPDISLEGWDIKTAADEGWMPWNGARG